MGLKAVCEEGIAVAIANEQNAFRRQRSLGLSDGLDLTLTLKAGENMSDDKLRDCAKISNTTGTPTHPLKLWDEQPSWEAAEHVWNLAAEQAAAAVPIKKLSHIPAMPAITADTAHHLKWKSLLWMVTKDYNRAILKGFLRHPLKYGWRYFKSVLRSRPYLRDGDFFLYGIQSIEEFRALLDDPQSLFVVGFSYCHKPFECPSGRFTPDCLHDKDNPICRQCFIGKAVHALPAHDAIPLFIPTVHYIGGKIFELMKNYPRRKIAFLITACEMTLEMFGDWGNMVGISGIGVRLEGRICNTMKAFELSENGIKPGLTVIAEKTQQRILDLIRHRRCRIE